MTRPTETDFRAVGYTGAAAEYPLTEWAWRAVVEINGVGDQLRAGKWSPPEAWKYAPGPRHRDWLEALGERLRLGLPLRESDGRVVRPSRMRVGEAAT